MISVGPVLARSIGLRIVVFAVACFAIPEAPPSRSQRKSHGPQRFSECRYRWLRLPATN